MESRERVPDKSRNTTLNPFEADSVDSLHLTQFSPSVFAKSVVTPSSSENNGKFRWSIDHLAVLHPADIDEHPIQQESTLDSDTEERAQQAIDKFFAQQHVVPSPWSVKRPVLKHVTFSPNPPTISEAEVSIAECNPQENASMRQHQERSEVSCQTTLSLPVDFDLLAALGDKFTIEDKDADDANELCTSTLRRKLFSVGEASPTISPVRGGLAHPSPERIPDIPSPQVSPIRQIDESTLSSSEISLVKTPGSAQSQFSSSPISRKMTPGRWKPHRQGSSVSGLIYSPSFSPISRTTYPMASDSSHPVFNSSDTSEAPPSDLVLPEASPILASTFQSQAGMIHPFLERLAPSSVEMMAMSFCANGNMSEKSPTSGVDTNVSDAPMTGPLDISGSFVGDSIDRRDSNDHTDSNDCRDSQASSPNITSSSMCSVEQSYLIHPRKFSDDLVASGSLSSGDPSFGDKDQDMLNPRGSSIYVSDDMASFPGDERLRNQFFTSQKLLTSTLKLVPGSGASVSLFNTISTTSKTHPLIPARADHTEKFRSQKSAALVGMNETSLRSKFIQREVMQSDSGFNTQSFTSMEVTDSDVVDIMQTNEYSVDGYPMSNKENNIRWKSQDIN